MVDVFPKVGEVLPQVDEVLPHCVETRCRSLPKVAQLAANLADIAISGAGKHPGGRGVLTIRIHPCVQIAHLIFKRGNTGLQIV